MSNWWEQPYRIVQTNLRQIDATLDPKEVVQSVKDFHANTLLFNVGGIVAFYPTELTYHHRNEFLESDVLAEVIEEAHNQGVRVIGRFDFSKATRKVYVDHPDWFWHTPEGKPVIYNGMYHTCINGGWYRGYAQEILSEALGRYPLDGLFFNMFGYQVRDYSGNYWGVCHCPGCREHFREISGMALPLTEDWNDPAFPQYVQFRRDTSKEVAGMIYAHAKQARPEAGVMLRFDTGDLIRREVNRAIDRELPEWGHGSGEQARWAAAFGRGKSYSSTLVHFVDIPYRFTADGPGCQGLRLAQQLANGAQPDYYVVGTLNQEDTKPYATVKELFAHHEANEDLYTEASSAARVGLYHSETTLAYQGNGDTKYQWNFRGAYKALVEAHIPFDIVTDRRMQDKDILNQLKRYNVILLSNAANLSQHESEILDTYVQEGGNLIVTYETALYDETGKQRSSFPLESLGVDTVEWNSHAMRSAYIRIDDPTLPGFEETRLMALDEGYVFTSTKVGAQERFQLVPPQRYGPPELCYPTEFSTRPGVVHFKYGAGETAYIPWPIDKLYYRHGLEDYRYLLAALVLELEPSARVIETNAPPHVEITVYNQNGDKQLRFVNYSGHQQTAYHPPIPIHGLSVTLDIDDTPEQVVGKVSGEPLEYKVENGKLHIDLPPLAYYEVVVIKGGANS